MSTFIIAEAGSNHNGNLKQAFKLISIAARAGADAVKFQTYSSETLYSQTTPDFAGYTNINALIKSIELPRDWQKDLKSYADSLDIEFMSTPFDEKAIEELYNLGVNRFKIAGFESSDPRFVRCVARTKLPLIISAGIGTSLEAISNIIEWIKIENSEPDITILHCNNAYPTPFSDINLSQISLIKQTYSDIKVGLSDHTEGILVPPLAVAKGASCIEKHFTISRQLPGPDHPFAIEPLELQRMVQNIRIAERCLGQKMGNLTHSEKRFQKAMRSVVSKCYIKKGEALTIYNITTKRPFVEDAVPAPKYFDVLDAYVSSEDIEEDSLIMWHDIARSTH